MAEAQACRLPAVIMPICEETGRCANPSASAFRATLGNGARIKSATSHMATACSALPVSRRGMPG
jgi:hypothetical protein